MYNHTGTVALTTDRLVLRRFDIDDAPEMFRVWSSDGEVARFMRWNAHKSVEETSETISKWVNGYLRNDFYLWAVTLKETGGLIGSIGISCLNAGDMCYDVAYNIGRDYWNRGYTSEALKAVLDHGLLTIGINRIEAYHSVNNPASGKVMQKCGMRYEGRLRQKYKSHLGFEDSDLYAIIREDMNEGGSRQMFDLEGFRQTVGAFGARLAQVPEEHTGIRLSEDKWTLKEIVGHLIDSASNNHQRFVRLQFGDLTDFPPYDGEKWIKVQKYADMDWKDIRALWLSYNLILLNIIGSVDPGAVGNVWLKGEEKLSLSHLINDYFRHLRWHMGHFEDRFKEVGGAG